jgi:hypothetical protein
LEILLEIFGRPVSISEDDDDIVLLGIAQNPSEKVARHVTAHFCNHAAFAGLAYSNSLYEPPIAPFAQSGSEDFLAELFRKQLVMRESLIPTVKLTALLMPSSVSAR